MVAGFDSAITIKTTLESFLPKEAVPLVIATDSKSLI